MSSEFDDELYQNDDEFEEDTKERINYNYDQDDYSFEEEYDDEDSYEY